MNFEIEVTNILEMKAYELTDEEKVQVFKKLGGSAAYEDIYE